MILYDADILEEDRTFLRNLLEDFPLAYVQGVLNGRTVSDRTIRARQLYKASGHTCIGYILLLGDVMKMREVVGDQNEAKVVVVARNSQWRVHEFLASEVAQNYVNLLVIVASEKSYYKEAVSKKKSGTLNVFDIFSVGLLVISGPYRQLLRHFCSIRFINLIIPLNQSYSRHLNFEATGINIEEGSFVKKIYFLFVFFFSEIKIKVTL